VTGPGELARWCGSATGLVEFGDGLLSRLNAYVSFDGAFFSAVDPATLLYTRAFRLGMPAEASGAFVSAEFGADDINQLRVLARGPNPVGWLDQATGGERTRARRYREAMEPYGLGDELRVALLADRTCWGVLCLHRGQARAGFTAAEASRLGAVGVPIAKALRRALLTDAATAGNTADGPGVLLLDRHGALRSSTPAGARWLAELDDLDRPSSARFPTVVAALLERLSESKGPLSREASARVLAPSGRWLTVHASVLDDAADSVAIVVEPTSPLSLAPLIVAAFALTDRENDVTQRLLVGLARKAIASQLGISLHTVNDHIKSIFDKTGASSVGELRMQIFHRSQAPAPLSARQRS
jgi:DNA-binding CsgD family transcriptional regulator